MIFSELQELSVDLIESFILESISSLILLELHVFFLNTFLSSISSFLLSSSSILLLDQVLSLDLTVSLTTGFLSISCLIFSELQVLSLEVFLSFILESISLLVLLELQAVAEVIELLSILEFISSFVFLLDHTLVSIQLSSSISILGILTINSQPFSVSSFK